MPTAMEMLAEVSEFPTSAAPDVQVRGEERGYRSPAFLDAALSVPLFLIVSWAALKLR